LNAMIEKRKKKKEIIPMIYRNSNNKPKCQTYTKNYLF